MVKIKKKKKSAKATVVRSPQSKPKLGEMDALKKLQAENEKLRAQLEIGLLQVAQYEDERQRYYAAPEEEADAAREKCEELARELNDARARIALLQEELEVLYSKPVIAEASLLAKRPEAVVAKQKQQRVSLSVNPKLLRIARTLNDIAD